MNPHSPQIAVAQSVLTELSSVHDINCRTAEHTWPPVYRLAAEVRSHALTFPWSSFLLFYVYEWFCSHVCLCTMSAWCPWRSEKGIRSPGTGIMDEGAENQTRSLASVGGALDHWTPSPALSCILFLSVPTFVLLSAIHFRVDSGTHAQCQSAVQCLWTHMG